MLKAGYDVSLKYDKHAVFNLYSPTSLLTDVYCLLCIPVQALLLAELVSIHCYYIHLHSNRVSNYKV